MFPGGESTTTSLIFIWGIIFICSIRGCYRNFQTGDYAWGTAFGILIPASAYFLADLLNLLPLLPQQNQGLPQTKPTLPLLKRILPRPKLKLPPKKPQKQQQYSHQKPTKIWTI